MQTPLHTAAKPGSAEKKQEGKDAQKVMRRLAQHLRVVGFERTKPSFFTRPRELVVEFVHIHKFTFGPYFRVHFGIRVRNDDFRAAHLNGPSSESFPDPAGERRHHRFEYLPEHTSIDSCAQALADFIGTQGMAWFQTLETPQQLLTSPDSPLRSQEKEWLMQALEQQEATTTSAATRDTLGIT